MQYESQTLRWIGSRSGKKGYPPIMVHLKMAPKGRGDSELGYPSSLSFFMLNMGKVCSSPISEGRWDCCHYRLPSGWQKLITLQVPKLRNAACENNSKHEIHLNTLYKPLNAFSNEVLQQSPGVPVNQWESAQQLYLLSSHWKSTNLDWESTSSIASRNHF